MRGHKTMARKRRTKKEEGKKMVGVDEKYASHVKSLNKP